MYFDVGIGRMACGFPVNDMIKSLNMQAHSFSELKWLCFRRLLLHGIGRKTDE